jgi:AcrR family transcriptional regulator
MPPEPHPVNTEAPVDGAALRTGRRERNKQDKLDRIMAAATALFAEHGVGDVTTQQIADRADIGTGTLFLYARTKGELLLMVQNSLYAEALAEGQAAAAGLEDPAAALMALLTPIVHCNRAQVENGRTYLRELAFGQPTEPHREAALTIVAQTSEAVASTAIRTGACAPADAAHIAELIQARMFLAMATSGPEVAFEEIVHQVARTVTFLVDHASPRR